MLDPIPSLLEGFRWGSVFIVFVMFLNSFSSRSLETFNWFSNVIKLFTNISSFFTTWNRSYYSTNGKVKRDKGRGVGWVLVETFSRRKIGNLSFLVKPCDLNQEKRITYFVKIHVNRRYRRVSWSKRHQHYCLDCEIVLHPTHLSERRYLNFLQEFVKFLRVFV